MCFIIMHISNHFISALPKEFERILQKHDPEIESIQSEFQILDPAMRSGAVEVKLTKMLDQWEQLLNNTQTHANRYVSKIINVSVISSK